MKRLIKNIIVFTLLITNFVYAEEVTAPTAEKKVDEEVVSEALRHGNSIFSENYVGPSKNIFSDDIIVQETKDDIVIINNDVTQIRYCNSYADIDDYRVETVQDEKHDRLKLKIYLADNVGYVFAKDGFYRLNGKTYYFDENELMVLGKAVDTKGTEFFFSYETGELIR